MTDFLNKKKQTHKEGNIQAEKNVSAKKTGLSVREQGNANADADGFVILDHEEDYEKILDNFDGYNEALDAVETQDIRNLMALGQRSAERTKYNPKSKGDAERVDVLKEQDRRILEYIEKLKNGTIIMENSEEALAQLERLLNRNETEILLNNQKMGGDSKYMKKVKIAVDAVEEQLAKEYKNGMTKADMEELKSTYLTAIRACNIYLENQGSRIKAWEGRKTLVREMRERLKSEVALVRLGTILYEQEESDEKLKKGADLITISRMYQLGSAMQTHIRQAAPESVKNVKNVDQAIRSLAPKLKDSKDIPVDTVPYVMEIRKFLSQTKPGEAKVGIITIGEKTGCIVHQENGLVRLEIGKRPIYLGDAEKIRDDIEMDISENKENKYSDEIIQQVLGEYAAIDILKQSPSALVRSRRMCTEILSERTGIAKPAFDNVSFYELRTLTSAFLAGHYSKKDIQEEVDYANKQKKDAVNTEAEMELMRSQTVDLTDVKYSITYVEKEAEWTVEEKQLKDMLAELIYFSDTREQDAFYGDKKNFDGEGNITREAAAKRMRDVLLKNVDVVSIIISDNYSKSIKNELNKNGLISKIRQENPGLSEEEIRKKADRDFVPEPTLLDSMLDKLPIFMAGNQSSMDARIAVNGAVSGVVKDILDGIEKSDMNGFEKFAAKLALNAPKMLEGKISEQLKGAEEGTEIFDKLADSYMNMQAKVAEMENNISSLMDKCTEIFFGEGEAKKTGEEKKEENKEEKKEEIKEEQKEEKKEEIKEEQKEEKKEEIKEEQKEEKKEEKVLSDEEKERLEIEASKARTKIIYDRIREKKEKYERSKILAKEFSVKKYDGKMSAEEADAGQEAEDYVDNYVKNESKALKQSMDDVAKGDKGQGAYFKFVMQSYFGALSTVDKRSMIASAIRNAKPMKKSYTAEEFEQLSDKDKMSVYGDYMGGMFKGAGPLFQKLLQGLPVGAIPAGLRKSVDDMKDSLAPIPEAIVKERMSAIVKNSRGRVKSIEVLKSLGAASVGQAFLCRVTGEGYPEGKEVVVKLLRPDVRNRMEREKKIMEEAAKKVDRKDAGIPDTNKEFTGGMYATFQGNYKRIAEELDLTIESKNVGLGQCYYNSSNKSKFVNKKVRVVQLDKDIEAGPDTMVLEKAEGVTAKKYMNDLRERINSVMDPFYKKKTAEDGTESYELAEDNDNLMYRIRSTYDGIDMAKFEDAKVALEEMIEQTEKRQKYLLEIADTWSREAIFKGGFYHGDLHAGNIMLDDNGATIIDFGNATQLTAEQVKHVTRMMVAAGRSDVEPFFEGYHALLENTPEKKWNNLKDELKAVFTEVLSMGNEKDAALRISVALMRAQELGFELPPAIANFASCQLRLQNAVDDMNKLLVELKASRATLDTMEIQDCDTFNDCSIQCFYSRNKVRCKDNKELYKEFNKKKPDFGISDNSEETKQAFLESLRKKDKRNDFLKDYVLGYSDRAEIKMLDLVLSKEYFELTDNEKSTIKNLNLVGRYLKRFKKKLQDICVEEKNMELSQAISDLMSYCNDVYYGQIKVDPVKYKPAGLMSYLEKSKLKDYLPKKTELDEAVDEFFKAQDNKASAAELKKLEEKVWTARTKMNPIPSAVNSFNETVNLMFSSFTHAHVIGRSEEYNLLSAKLTNGKLFKSMSAAIGTFAEDPEIGEQVKTILEEYKVLLDRASVNLSPAKDAEIDNAAAELKKKVMQIVDADAHRRAAMRLEEKIKKEIDKPKYIFAGKDFPDDFFDVMGDVIQRNKIGAVSRVGVLKSAVILGEMAGEGISNLFKKITGRED